MLCHVVVALPAMVLGLQRFHQPPGWEAAGEGEQPKGYRFPSSRMYPPAADVGFTVPAELRNPTDRWFPPAPESAYLLASDLRPHYGDFEARPVPKKKMNLAEFLFNRLNDKNRRKPLKV